jgi:hypothetical protein
VIRPSRMQLKNDGVIQRECEEEEEDVENEGKNI